MTCPSFAATPTLRGLLGDDCDDLINESISEVLPNLITTPGERYTQSQLRIHRNDYSLCFSLSLLFDLKDNKILACLSDELQETPPFDWSQEQESAWREIQTRVRQRQH